MTGRNNGLRPDLTFEEFEALANRQPNLKGSWLYKVTQAIFYNDLKYPYPKFELDYPRELYFKTFNAAEKYVKKNTKDVYCSWISQIPYGLAANYGGSGAEWLYDQHGELLDYTITWGQFGKAEDYTFFGRPKSRMRFKVGDIVEVVGDCKVRLAVFNVQIPDVKRCWKIYNKCYQNKDDLPYFMDFSDDTATVIDGPCYYYHDHVSPLQLMKPRFPIPKDILLDMQTWNSRSRDEDDSLWFKAGGTVRTENQKEKGETIGEFYELRIYLHFDENNENPHLHINDLYGLKVGLRIDRPEYYDHGEYTGRLTGNQIECLYRHLTSPDLEKTKWWYMLRKWNEYNDNPALKLPLDTPLPDYLRLLK